MLVTWPLIRSRYLFTQRDIRGEDAPLASATKDGVLLREELDFSVWNPGSDVSSYKLVEPDDFVIGLRSFQHGISHSRVRGNVSPAYTVLRGTQLVSARFFKYFFRSKIFISQLANLTQGIRQGKSIDIAAFADLKIPVPPIEEQCRIADFLDGEMVRADTLSLVYKDANEIVAERVQARIDMLVESAGHPVPLKYFVRFREGPGIMAVDFRDTGTPLVRVSGLREGTVTLLGANYVDDDLAARKWAQFRLRLGDYLISASATMGAVSVVKDPSVVGAIPYTGLIILRPADAEVDMNYVAVTLNSTQFKRQIDVLKAGAAMQHFGPTHLSQIYLPFPSYQKQVAIASAAYAAQNQASEVIGVIDSQLTLLAERREALITAAVTGQIDDSALRIVTV